MINLDYSLVIEATEEPDYFGFYSPDLEGFSGKGCQQVFDDFRGGDLLKVERKKLDYYSRPQVEREKSQR